MSCWFLMHLANMILPLSIMVITTLVFFDVRQLDKVEVEVEWMVDVEVEVEVMVEVEVEVKGR